MEKIEDGKSPNPKQNREKKTRRIHMVVTESEYKQFLEYAQEHKNVSDYIRECCLVKNKKSFEKTKEVKKLLKNLSFEMNAVGTNINQIARYTNFLLENKITFDSINRFNTAILQYTAIQIRFEKLLKKIFD